MWLVAPVSDNFIASEECILLTSMRTLKVITGQQQRKQRNETTCLNSLSLPTQGPVYCPSSRSLLIPFV